MPCFSNPGGSELYPLQLNGYLLTIDGISSCNSWAYTRFMPCPACGSNRLLLREATGFERVVLLFIAKRKYRCRDCNHAYRAVDRRRIPRDRVAMSKEVNIRNEPSM